MVTSPWYHPSTSFHFSPLCSTPTSHRFEPSSLPLQITTTQPSCSSSPTRTQARQLAKSGVSASHPRELAAVMRKAWIRNQTYDGPSSHEARRVRKTFGNEQFLQAGSRASGGSHRHIHKDRRRTHILTMTNNDTKSVSSYSNLNKQRQKY